jgi:hypothetical protein
MLLIDGVLCVLGIAVRRSKSICSGSQVCESFKHFAKNKKAAAGLNQQRPSCFTA